MIIGGLEFVHFPSLSKLTNAGKWGRCVIGARLEVALHGNRKHIHLNRVTGEASPFLVVTAIKPSRRTSRRFNLNLNC